MSRSVWVDPPNDPDYDTLAKHGITDPIFDARWLSRLAKPLEYLKAVRDKTHGTAGAYFCSQGSDSLGTWPSHLLLSGPEWADWAYNLLQKTIAPGTSGGFPVAHLNPETDDVEWQLSMLQRWRARSPKRVTVWSPPAHKATVFTDIGYKLAAMNVIVSPQCYVGEPMERVESANEVLAWAAIGVPTRQIQPMLDARTLGHWWGEIGGATAFTMGGLSR